MKTESFNMMGPNPNLRNEPKRLAQSRKARKKDRAGIFLHGVLGALRKNLRPREMKRFHRWAFFDF